MIECAFHRKSVCTEEELKWIAVTDGPYIRREATHGTPTWIWPLVVDSELYVRPNDKTSSRPYKDAMTRDVGRITPAGLNQSRIDEASWTKYKNNPICTDDRFTCPCNIDENHAKRHTDQDER